MQILGESEPIPGIGGGNNIDSRQSLRFRGLGRGRGWATEIGLQLGNPQILLPKLLCCCPQGEGGSHMAGLVPGNRDGGLQGCQDSQLG